MLRNSLFLSLCAQLNGEISGKVVGWFHTGASCLVYQTRAF